MDSTMTVMFHLILFVVVWRPQTALQTVCPGTPAECTCDDNIRVNCSFRSLNDIPSAFPGNVSEIHLRGNNITSIGQGKLTNYTNLVHLDLSHNKIFYIHHGAFRHLNKLETLLINSNILNFTLLLPGSFDGLVSLQTIDISGNALWLQLAYYPSSVLASLKALKHLIIDGIDGVRFDAMFSNLLSLESLRIHSMIKHLSNETLSVFQNAHLTSITIWSGWLESIDSHAFAHFPFLETLDLSFNPRLGFHNASKAWPGLRHTNISTLILERASPFETAIVTIEPEFFCGLEYTQIKKLVLDGNNIVTVHSLFSRYLPYLEHLSFSRNRLVQVNSFILDIGNLMNLRYLDVSHQAKRLPLTEPELLAGLIPLQTSQPQLQTPTLKGALTRPIHESRCNFTDSDLDDGTNAPNPLYLPVWEMKVPSTLEHLKLSGSLTLELDNLPKTILINGLSLKKIEYASNGLSRFEGAFIMVNRSSNPVSLDLSDNGCTFLEEVVFTNDTAESINELLLSKNKLGDFLNHNTGKVLMETVTNLEKLDLTENGIKSLPNDIFVHLTELRVLQLGHNALRALSVDLGRLVHLERLEINHNLISTLPDTIIHQLTHIARVNSDKTVQGEKYTLAIDMSENPITCSCDSRPFLRWVETEHFSARKIIHFEKFDDYYCFFDSREFSWKNRSLTVLIDKLDWECNRTLIIILCTTLSVVLALVIVISVCVHRHKWDIRFWCIHMIIKKKEKHSNDCFREYKYDAFVAYHENSLSWVKYALMTNLEGNLFDPINLCVHHRDFIPGKAIEENIVESIKDSRKTILVITKDFIQSSWCYFEMQMARTASFDEKRDIIIAILLEPVSTKTEGLSQTLLNILRRQTYLVWPEDKSLRPQFWHRLHQAIRSPRQRPTRCECGRTFNTELPQRVNELAGPQNEVYEYENVNYMV